MFNYSLYEKTIFKNLLLDKDEWYFKSDKSYTEILEHVSFESGLKYLLLIEDKFNFIYTNNKEFIIDICYLNDKYGKTIKQNFKNFCCCSPSNIRYIFHALLILEHLIKINLNNIDIVEIGGGYGGLCLFLYKLSTLFNITINSYSIFDLNEPMKLQKKYLEIHNIPINTISLDDENIKLNKDSFLISNYAFSEISMSLQKLYKEKVIDPFISHGFLTWNIINIYKFTDRDITYEKEYPETGNNNLYVYF